MFSKPLIELRNLKQSASVSEYNSNFNALRNQVNVPNDMLLDLYLGGLMKEIMHTVQLLDPKTLNQAMKLARIHEGALYALWGLEPPKQPDTHLLTQTQNNSPLATFRNPFPCSNLITNTKIPTVCTLNSSSYGPYNQRKTVLPPFLQKNNPKNQQQISPI